jgi:hypothetical protein
MAVKGVGAANLANAFVLNKIDGNVWRDRNVRFDPSVSQETIDLFGSTVTDLSENPYFENQLNYYNDNIPFAISAGGKLDSEAATYFNGDGTPADLRLSNTAIDTREEIAGGLGNEFLSLFTVPALVKQGIPLKQALVKSQEYTSFGNDGFAQAIANGNSNPTVSQALGYLDKFYGKPVKDVINNSGSYSRLAAGSAEATGLKWMVDNKLLPKDFAENLQKKVTDDLGIKDPNAAQDQGRRGGNRAGVSQGGRRGRRSGGRGGNVDGTSQFERQSRWRGASEQAAQAGGRYQNRWSRSQQANKADNTANTADATKSRWSAATKRANSAATKNADSAATKRADSAATNKVNREEASKTSTAAPAGTAQQFNKSTPPKNTKTTEANKPESKKDEQKSSEAA